MQPPKAMHLGLANNNCAIITLAPSLNIRTECGTSSNRNCPNASDLCVEKMESMTMNINECQERKLLIFLP